MRIGNGPIRGRSAAKRAGALAGLAAALALAAAATVTTALPPADDAGFDPMPAPKPGDWLHSFPERHQSAADHRASCRNRATADRRTIYVLPVGKIAERRPEVMGALTAYLGAYFGLPCAVLTPAAPPPEAWNAGRKQVDGDAILEWLKERVPDDAAACGAFIEEDLWSGDLNFVFGVASLSDRVGVYSIARLDGRYEGMPAAATLLRRTLGLATHELGHVFGIDHCIRYRCNMNGSNSLRESDGQPLHCCPVELEKLEWACGVDRRKRYEALEAFYRRHDLEAEADFCAARLGRAVPR